MHSGRKDRFFIGCGAFAKDMDVRSKGCGQNASGVILQRWGVNAKTAPKTYANAKEL